LYIFHGINILIISELYLLISAKLINNLKVFFEVFRQSDGLAMRSLGF